MSFEEYIGNCDLGDMSCPYEVLDGFIQEYFSGVKMDKIRYLFTDNEVTWYIEPLNEYTIHIFKTDLKILEREHKIKKLLYGRS